MVGIYSASFWMNELIARLQPLLAILRDRIGGGRPLEGACLRYITLSPEERSEMPPVLIGVGDRARVISAQPETTLEREWMRIDGAVAVHQATRRYVFKNVLATPFGFFAGGSGFARFGRPQLRKLFTEDIRRLEKGFYACSPISLKYFGHWLLDGLPSTLLAQKDEALYVGYDRSWCHAPAYLDLLGITRIPNDFVLFDEMTFCVDIGQNENRRERIRRLRECLQATVTGRGNTLVYLKRGKTGARRTIVNEDQLIAALEAEGFITVIADAPLSEILSACHGASTIVSVEGSHMAHGMLAAAEGALHVTLNPYDRFNNVFADYMPALRSRLGTIVMERAGEDYHVDIPRALEFLRLRFALAST